MDITQLITKSLLGNLIPMISKKLDIPEKTVSAVVSKGFPLLLSALSKNSKDPKEAENISKAISKDHTGNLLSNLSSLFNEDTQDDGGKILKHILGEDLGKATKTIGEKTNTKPSDVKSILVSVAPVLLESLGKKKQEEDLDTSDFTGLLKEVAKGTDLKGGNLVTDLLDQNDDGNVVDDVIGLVGKFLKKK